MAKRFTDTAKWDKPWFRKLSQHHKCIWFFLVDRCDHAGIWTIDLETMAHYIGGAVTLEEVTQNFEVKRVDDDKLFLPSFIEFQYGELHESNNAHRSVLNRLKKLGLIEGLMSPSRGGQDKEKDKDKDKDQEKEKDTEKPQFDFEVVYRDYPCKRGKVDGIAECKKQIRSPQDYADLVEAVEKYRAYVTRAPSYDGEFIPEPMHFSTFMRKGRWRECLEADFGDTGKGRSKPKVVLDFSDVIPSAGDVCSDCFANGPCVQHKGEGGPKFDLDKIPEGALWPKK